jgi:hypothetical protein
MSDSKDINPLWVAGGLAVAGYFILKGNASAAPGTSVLSQLQNAASSAVNVVSSGTTYPYLVTGSPALPPAYNQQYYAQFIRPAMVAANSNVNNPGYTLSPVDVANYMANYTDVAQWANNTGPSGGARHQTPAQAAQYHWKTFGVPDQRTFLPLPWNDPGQWVPPPANSNSSGSGSVLKTVGTVASLVGMFLGPDDKLNDAEIDLIVTSAAIIKKILPFYLDVAPELVHSIDFKLDNLISQYAN